MPFSLPRFPLSTKWPACAHAWTLISRRCAAASAATNALALTLSMPVAVGGSCFPKDVRALIRTAEQEGIEPGILRAVEARNALQKTLLFQALREHFSGYWQGRVVALWGLAFKPGTDDLREAPSLVLLDALLAAGVRVQAYDPVARAGVAARYSAEVERGQLRIQIGRAHV